MSIENSNAAHLRKWVESRAGEPAPEIAEVLECNPRGYRYYILSMPDDSIMDVNPVPSSCGEEWLYAVIATAEPEENHLIVGDDAERIRMLIDAQPRTRPVIEHPWELAQAAS